MILYIYLWIHWDTSTFHTRRGPPSLLLCHIFFYILVPHSATRLAAPVTLTPHRVEYGVSHPLTPSSSPVTVLYCTVLYCTVLYCTVLYCTVLYCTVLYCTVLYCTVLYYTVLYCTVQYWTALHCTALHCTALHCTALH